MIAMAAKRSKTENASNIAMTTTAKRTARPKFAIGDRVTVDRSYIDARNGQLVEQYEENTVRRVRAFRTRWVRGGIAYEYLVPSGLGNWSEERRLSKEQQQ